MLKSIISTLLLLSTLYSASQPGITEAEIILQSRHVWRGQRLGSTMAIEPSVTATLGRFSFNVWAAVTPDNSYSEIDLIPSWQFKYFQLSLLDYYNPVAGERNRYLNFKDGLNRHSVEASIDNYSVDKHRFKWMVSTFILGDKNKETGNPYYSTYIEFRYPFTFWGIAAEPFAGLTPHGGYYSKQFALVNTGLCFSRELDFKLPFTVPLSLSLITNPSTRNSFATFATGIAF